MKCTLSDSLEWLYPDSSIAGEPVTALECDAPAGGVADVNILVADAAPDAPLRYSSDAPQAGTVEVLFENRSLELKDGRFTDAYPAHFRHIYKILQRSVP